jgi:hypothetical protein
MPEGRGNEGGHVVSQTGLLSRNQCPIVYVMLEPEVNLMVPMLHHDLRREAELDIGNVDAVDLVEPLLPRLLVLTGIPQSRRDNRAISDAPA